MESKRLRPIIPYLPQEIMTDILSRLPVKSLFRFKSTSKSWRSLISSKYFIKTHSTKNSTSANQRIIFLIEESKPELRHCSLHSLLNESVTPAKHGVFPIDKSVHSLKLVGSCNGLICILINKKEFFLWNPATTESKKLPVLKFNDFDRITERGFGFDESSGDYKVYSVCSGEHIANVYSLKTDSWTTVHEYPTDGSIAVSGRGKFVSSNLHWCRLKYEPLSLDCRMYVSTFDLKNEVYGIIEQPNVLDGDFVPTLGVLDGCLTLFYYNPNHKYLDLYILKQYGVRDSWSKLLRIHEDLLTRFGWCIPFYVAPQNRQILFTHRRNLVIYYPKENDFRVQKMIGLNKFLKLVYIESLEPLVVDVEE